MTNNDRVRFVIMYSTLVKSSHRPFLSISLRSAVAGRIYNHCENHTSNSVLTEPLCRAQAILYALPNNERGTKYLELTYSARQTVRESVGLPISRGKLVCEFDLLPKLAPPGVTLGLYRNSIKHIIV